MFQRLLLLFITLPLAEILILIKLGEILGFWWTVGLVIGTGILGASLARLYGWAVWLDIQQELARGRMPTDRMVDGLLILVGGIVLLTPGLITDITGFLLLIPPTRSLVKQWLKRQFEARLTPRDENEIFRG
ncbi:MAG: FxsA family protein [Candidatus Neomarinimicrobiota bacterium]|nr:MAG: FxsA family protein [Candidatus Neomarinimicrobiota bacterium]